MIVSTDPITKCVNSESLNEILSPGDNCDVNNVEVPVATVLPIVDWIVPDNCIGIFGGAVSKFISWDKILQLLLKNNF